uniref:Uncharacterized protein n=1 Tax=Strigops habroptila TaxID=2489341 RepID=A0A672UJ17_STRHB
MGLPLCLDLPLPFFLSPPFSSSFFSSPFTSFLFLFLFLSLIHVQGDLPAVRGLADLGDAAAELPAQRLPIGRTGSRQQRALPGQEAEIAGPGAAARPLVPILRDMGHPEGLVEQAAAMVPVSERVPAGAAQEGEGDAALGHGAAGGGRHYGAL